MHSSYSYLHSFVVIYLSILTLRYTTHTLGIGIPSTFCVQIYAKKKSTYFFFEICFDKGVGNLKQTFTRKITFSFPSY